MSLKLKVEELTTQVVGAHQDLQGFVAQFAERLKIGMYQELYVDPDLGNDANDGLSWATAKVTIGAAVALIPDGGSGKINLIKGKTHELSTNISCDNRFIYIDGIADFDYTGTYAIIRGKVGTAGNLITATHFNTGQNGFLYLRGCRLETAKYPTGLSAYTPYDYAVSLLGTNSGWGNYCLEHCQVILNNGPMMHQHSAGSFGCADLYMREISVTRTPVEELADTRRNAVLMGTHGNAPIPFRLFAYRVILNNIATLKELFTQTLENAKTNVV